MARNKNAELQIHILDAFHTEVGVPKAKTFSQDFTWNKRTFPISPDAVGYVDKKGVKHLFCDANEADGTLRWLSPRKVNLLDSKGDIIDKCAQCGGKISIDASNVRDLVKRKTISTFWGLDSSHILLLLVMGIIAIGAFGGLFYLLGQNQNLQSQLNKYLPTAEEIKESRKIPVNPNFILGVLS